VGPGINTQKYLKRSVNRPRAIRIALDVPGFSDTSRDAALQRAACIYGGIALRHHHPMQLSWQKLLAPNEF
jgi:hypothetical protein